MRPTSIPTVITPTRSKSKQQRKQTHNYLACDTAPYMIRSPFSAARAKFCAHSSIRAASQWTQESPGTNRSLSCSCQPMPPGLDIDHDSKMTFSPYRQHILVCTGQSDWASKIELDCNTGPVTRNLKTLLGPRASRRGQDMQSPSSSIIPGKYHNVRCVSSEPLVLCVAHCTNSFSRAMTCDWWLESIHQLPHSRRADFVATPSYLISY